MHSDTDSLFEDIIVVGTLDMLRPCISQIAAQNECEAEEPRRRETSEHFGIIHILCPKGKKEVGIVVTLTLQGLPGERTLLEIAPGPQTDRAIQRRFLLALRAEFARLGLLSPSAKSQPPDKKPRMGFLSQEQ
jgi:hypothetical protein